MVSPALAPKPSPPMPSPAPVPSFAAPPPVPASGPPFLSPKPAMPDAPSLELPEEPQAAAKTVTPRNKAPKTRFFDIDSDLRRQFVEGEWRGGTEIYEAEFCILNCSARARVCAC